MIELLIATAAGGSVWLAFSKKASSRDKRLVSRIAALTPENRAKRRRLQSVKESLVRFAARLPGNRVTVRGSLVTAGRENWSPDAVIGARFVAATAGFLVGLLFGALAPLTAVAFAFTGYRLPDLLLGVRARAKRDDLRRDLPDAVDLLAVCTQAGLNLPLALNRVAAGISGPLGVELRRTVSEIDLGIPRSKALADLAARTEVTELESLVGLLQTSERFGTKVAASLTTFGGDIRLQRKRRAEEQARRAPVKMLFPLVFLILPGFILLTLVPLLLGTFESLGF